MQWIFAASLGVGGCGRGLVFFVAGVSKTLCVFNVWGRGDEREGRVMERLEKLTIGRGYTSVL
jgi:hypothetical protein